MIDNTFTPLHVDDLLVNPVNLIAKNWMLITAGNSTSYNTMTASWGGLGHMWNKPCAFIVIRPQRYTFEFTERFDSFSLCFFDEIYRHALNVCGSKSGRNTDKVKEAGLHTLFTPKGTPVFREASLVLECKKLYAQLCVEENFIDKSIIDAVYPKKDFHKLYIAEITDAWTKVGE